MKHFIILFIFLYSLNSIAQLKVAYEPATVKLVNGEKIQGFVKLTDLSKISLGILFKENENVDKITKFSSNEILQLNINENEVYDTQIVKVSKAKKGKMILAKKLVEGLASLYKFELYGKEYYNLVTPDSTYLLQNDEIDGGILVKYFFRIALKNALDLKDSDVESYNFSFLESDFIKIVSDFNLKTTNLNRILKLKAPIEKFLLGFIGGRIKGKQNEIFLQLIQRIYFPKVNEGGSLNFGFNYYNSYRADDLSTFKIKYFSFPISIQHNFLNKKVRPYLFGGLSPMYILSYQNDGFRESKNLLKVYFNGGVGIEANMNKIFFKSEIRFEIYRHLLNFGIGMNLK